MRPAVSVSMSVSVLASLIDPAQPGSADAR
jgi:hypothetical protein